MTRKSQPLQADGLYDERYEHDSCGVAVVARLDNRASNEVVRLAIEALANLEHRGAAGADPETGDGAGILVQMPDALLRDTVPFELPQPGRYGVAMCFLPTDPLAQAELVMLLETVVAAEG
jgi:glutamate synthase domain-containing protein 1